MAELTFTTGTMAAGKSTMALQLHHSLGGSGVIFTMKDRGGEGVITSRLGIEHQAVEVTADLDICTQAYRMGAAYVIADECQFYSELQVNQLAALVDVYGIDVYAFGLLTDFRGRLFPGSKRLVELADRIETLPVAARCWCGAKATHNARVHAGFMETEGSQVMVGDKEYQTLCRRHFTAGSIGL